MGGRADGGSISSGLGPPAETKTHLHCSHYFKVSWMSCTAGALYRALLKSTHGLAPLPPPARGFIQSPDIEDRVSEAERIHGQMELLPLVNVFYIPPTFGAE